MFAAVIRALFNSGLLRTRDHSVLILVAEAPTWRFDSLISALQARGLTCRVAFAQFGHNRPSQVSETFVQNLRSRGLEIRFLSWRSFADLVWVHEHATVIFNHPYKLLNAPASIRSLSNSRTIYIPYTLGFFRGGGHNEYTVQTLKYSDVVCVETLENYEEVAGMFPFCKSRLECVGFPSINGHLPPKLRGNANSGLRILLAPHWTSFRNDDQFDQVGFIGAVEALRTLSISNSAIQVRYRPHPHLDEYLPKLRCAQYFRDLVIDFARSDSPNPMEDLIWADVVVGDSGAFAGECVFLDVPLIFWKPGSAVASILSRMGEECLQASYGAFSGVDIENFLAQLLGGNDPQATKRRLIRDSVKFDDFFEAKVLDIVTNKN